MEKTIARLHYTIIKMGISILYHVIVNSELNCNNLTKCYIINNQQWALDLYLYPFKQQESIWSENRCLLLGQMLQWLHR